MRIDVLKLGAVGCGRAFERMHLPAVQQSSRWELVAACEPSMGRRRWLEERLPGLALYDSVRELLKHSSCDAVLIATTPSTHVQIAQQALEAGLHVLLEKPGGSGLAQASELAKLADSREALIWIGYNRRFRPSYLRLKTLLGMGSGAGLQTVHFEMVLSPGEWDPISHFQGEQGGDVLYDVGSHQIDLLTWLLGQKVNGVEVERWEKESGQGEQLGYRLTYEGGVSANCRAAHGDGYGEQLFIELSDRNLLTYPNGLISGRRMSHSQLAQWARILYWLERKLMRLGILQDELAGSYLMQWDAFAATIGGAVPSVEGASVRENLHTHQTLDRLRSILREIGVP